MLLCKFRYVGLLISETKFTWYFVSDLQISPHYSLFLLVFLSSSLLSPNRLASPISEAIALISVTVIDESLSPFFNTFALLLSTFGMCFTEQLYIALYRLIYKNEQIDQIQNHI